MSQNSKSAEQKKIPLIFYNIPTHLKTWQVYQLLTQVFESIFQQKIEFETQNSQKIKYFIICKEIPLEKALEISQSTFLPKTQIQEISQIPITQSQYEKIRIVCGYRNISENQTKYESVLDNFYHDQIFNYFQFKNNNPYLTETQLDHYTTNLIQQYLDIIGYGELNLNSAFFNSQFWQNIVNSENILQETQKNEDLILNQILNPKNEIQKMLENNYTKCKNTGCGKIVEKQKIEEHYKKFCEFEQIICSNCFQTYIQFLRNRHENICSNLQPEPYQNQMIIIQNFPKIREKFDIKEFFEIFGPIENFSFKKEEKTRVLNFFCKYDKLETAIYVKQLLEDVRIQPQQTLPLAIEYHKSKEELQLSRVYIQGLETNNLTLIQQYCEKYGNIKLVKELKNQYRKKNICYIEFFQVKDAQLLINDVKSEKNTPIGRSIKYSSYSLEYLEKNKDINNQKGYNYSQYINSQSNQQQFVNFNNNYCNFFYQPVPQFYGQYQYDFYFYQQQNQQQKQMQTYQPQQQQHNNNNSKKYQKKNYQNNKYHNINPQNYKKVPKQQQKQIDYQVKNISIQQTSTSSDNSQSNQQSQYQNDFQETPKKQDFKHKTSQSSSNYQNSTTTGDNGNTSSLSEHLDDQSSSNNNKNQQQTQEDQQLLKINTFELQQN